MTAIITCKACGATNRLGVLFCSQCGAKLDLSEANVNRSMKKERRREKSQSSGGLGVVVRILRWTVFVVVLAALIGLFIPAGQVGMVGDPVDAQRLDQKQELLRIAILDRRAQSVLVFEREINAYLAEGVRQAGAAGGGLTYRLDEVRVDLAEEGITVWFGGGLGPLPLTYTVRGTASAGAQGWRFDPSSISIGRIPVPAVFRSRVEKQLAGVFSGMSEERQLLKRIVVWETQDDQAKVGTGGSVP